MSNTRDSDSAGMPTPVSLTVTIALSCSRRAAIQMRPPGSVYLAALLSRFDEHLRETHGVGIETECFRRERDLERVIRRVDQRAARLDSRRDHVGEIHAALAQLDLAARDARDVQQVVDQPHHVVDLALHDLVGGHRGLRRARQRRTLNELRIGASGLRSSCASVARNWFLRSSAASRSSRWARVSYCRARARNALRTALASAGTRTGRSSSVTLPSVLSV